MHSLFFAYPCDLTVVALVTASVVASLLLIIFYRGRIRKVSTTTPSGAHDVVPIEDSNQPSLSVIVYDRESPSALSKLLDDIFRQEYGGDFEVIVVSDGHSPQSSDVVNRLSRFHNNLRLTFVPDEAHALSRKKLAITLGVKAARHNSIVLTEAECSIPSSRWLQSIADSFSMGKSLIIMHSYPIDSSGEQGSAMQSFDTLADCVTYLSSAFSGKPYRGNSANLAFTRKAFFACKGFADSVGLHHGEDDIFVSRIAPFSTPAVIVNDDTILPLHVHDYKQMHRLSKLSHRFTSRFVSQGSRLFFGFCSLLMWIWLAATIAAAILSGPNLLPVTLCIAVGIAWLAVAVAAWKKAAFTLHIAIKPWLLPMLMFMRPIYNFTYRLRARAVTERNFTWAKGLS